MADVYLDNDLSTGLNNGSSWANAYQHFDQIGSLSAGDTLWVKGNTNTSTASKTLNVGTQFNPVRMIGVKSATTNEPPVASDVIAGLRSGGSTPAHENADRPVVIMSTAHALQMQGFWYVYGVEFEAQGTSSTFLIATVDRKWGHFEECKFTKASGSLAIGQANAGDMCGIRLINCALDTTNASGDITLGQRVEIIGLKYIATVAKTSLFRLGVTDIGQVDFIGCDFSAVGSNSIFQGIFHGASIVRLRNCQFGASTVLVSSGAADGEYRVEAYNCSSVTGKSSGTVTDLEIVDAHGDIVEETTAVRTGGANDGSTTHSWAMTPDVNTTVENELSLISPWIVGSITGDGTSKTVTVYIANSGAGDYNNDDVWLEVLAPSEGGTAQHQHTTTQADVLATPSAVTDDVISTWGTGASNPQKLQATIAPDYKGAIYVRVHFAKAFAASPETLYVDPKLEIA